ncbi:hypothetical protein FQN50_008940 [Emmonsiellopsis sp. PD_5]|nr:hypothetical protein FQN50_008940 [Emmonsiellopsis sp. PD_5]
MSSKVSEERSSQSSLGPPVEIKIPSTPIPSRASLSASPNRPAMEQNSSTAANKPSLRSSALPPSSSEMTPPPSSQQLLHAATPFRRSRSHSNSFLASPPATIDQTLCVAYGASEDLPTPRDIEEADETRLRKIAMDLLVFAKEFRMSAAHFKLQHSLLSLTSSEAVKRAEVEQQLARREVEILQSAEYRHRRGLSLEKSPQLSPNTQQSDATSKRMKELEDANFTLERRLRRAKRVIEEENDKYELLAEENSRLKKRIRENREHFTLMMDHGSLSSSPQTEFLTPQRKTTATRYPDSARSHMSRVGSQDPIAALLAAGQVLHTENANVHSTPPRNRDIHKHNQGHSRGTHSLSSLPITPSRSRATESQGHFFTPINKRTPDSRHQRSHREERDRHDRDSTLSASDEEALTDEDIPASQASSLATSMLRRYPTSSQENSMSSNIGKSSSILQSKLFGQVKKAGVERPSESLKRKSGYSDKEMAAKKMRIGEALGLGIQS